VGLTQDCRSLIGSRVLCEPGYGYGWNQQIPDGAGQYPAIDVPKPFHMTIDRFFEVGDELRGGIGTIREPGHPLDLCRVSFSTRHVGEWDFSRHLAQYNLQVGAEERASQSGWLFAVGGPSLVGFGSIRVDAAQHLAGADA
jgi:hypothetical protein